MTRRNLILIHRGNAYERDFEEIAEKVYAIDPSITVFVVPGHLGGALPATEWRYPTLTVALTSKFKLPIRRGPILQTQQIGKLAQQDILRQHGIPTPPALPFTFGMTLDPVIFGDRVVLKPMDLTLTSQGVAFLFSRERGSSLAPEDLPRDHLIRLYPNSFMVQKYIHTGTKPYIIRIGTFLAKAIFCYTSGSPDELVHPGVEGDLLAAGVGISPVASERKRQLVFDEDAIQLAEATHRAFGSVPLLGIDLVRDHATGELFVLETNPGGNTWHFTSKNGEPTRRSLAPEGRGSDASRQGRLVLLEQFGAFDTAAKLLVAKTQELSS
jgi:hypothetical protein